MGVNKSHYVKYNITVHRIASGYLKPYVYSQAFTSEERGLVQVAYTKYRNLDIQELDVKLPGDSRMTLMEMLLMDALSLNIDRHKGNYGFIKDNNSLRLVGLAPIYDLDCSLGALRSI